MSQVTGLFERLADKFYPPAARGLNIVYQFELLDGGNYFIAINEGACTVSEGEHENPSIVLTMESETLASVMAGSLGSVQAFMFGKVAVKGDLLLAKRLSEIFSA